MSVKIYRWYFLGGQDLKFFKKMSILITIPYYVVNWQLLTEFIYYHFLGKFEVMTQNKYHHSEQEHTVEHNVNQAKGFWEYII